MSLPTVEEIMTEVRKLPQQDRRRLSALLEQEGDAEMHAEQTHIAAASPHALDQIPPTRAAEMQWLLEHQDFWEQHRGEHVALWGYEMIAVSKTRKAVVDAARQRGIKFPFVQYLPVHEHEWYLVMSNQAALASWIILQ